MKTELRVKPHSVLPGQSVIELWHDGQLIGTVAGADGPGVKIITKHPVEAAVVTDPPLPDGRTLRVVEVNIKPA